jgi:hypothetical protein
MGCSNSSAAKGKAVKSASGGVKELKRNYKINTHVLGAGSFGKVFLAENLSDHTH